MGVLVMNCAQIINDVYKILVKFNDVFNPPLNTKVIDMESFAEKLISNGYVYYLSIDNQILGFVAFYANDNINKIGYLTQIAVKTNCNVKGIGYILIKQFEKVSCDCGMRKAKLEVDDSNKDAINFYKRNGYKFSGQASNNSSYMIKNIGTGGEQEIQVDTF